MNKKFFICLVVAIVCLTASSKKLWAYPSPSLAAGHYVTTGKKFFKVKDYDRAIDQFNKALMADPDNEEAKLYLRMLGFGNGECRGTQGDCSDKEKSKDKTKKVQTATSEKDKAALEKIRAQNALKEKRAIEKFRTKAAQEERAVLKKLQAQAALEERVVLEKFRAEALKKKRSRKEYKVEGTLVENEIKKARPEEKLVEIKLRAKSVSPSDRQGLAVGVGMEEKYAGEESEELVTDDEAQSKARGDGFAVGVETEEKESRKYIARGKTKRTIAEDEDLDDDGLAVGIGMGEKYAGEESEDEYVSDEKAQSKARRDGFAVGVETEEKESKKYISRGKAKRTPAAEDEDLDDDGLAVGIGMGEKYAGEESEDESVSEDRVQSKTKTGRDGFAVGVEDQPPSTDLEAGLTKEQKFVLAKLRAKAAERERNILTKLNAESAKQEDQLRAKLRSEAAKDENRLLAGVEGEDISPSMLEEEKFKSAETAHPDLQSERKKTAVRSESVNATESQNADLRRKMADILMMSQQDQEVIKRLEKKAKSQNVEVAHLQNDLQQTQESLKTRRALLKGQGEKLRNLQARLNSLETDVHSREYSSKDKQLECEKKMQALEEEFGNYRHAKSKSEAEFKAHLKTLKEALQKKVAELTAAEEKLLFTEYKLKNREKQYLTRNTQFDELKKTLTELENRLSGLNKITDDDSALSTIEPSMLPPPPSRGSLLGAGAYSAKTEDEAIYQRWIQRHDKLVTKLKEKLLWAHAQMDFLGRYDIKLSDEKMAVLKEQLSEVKKQLQEKNISAGAGGAGGASEAGQQENYTLIEERLKDAQERLEMVEKILKEKDEQIQELEKQLNGVLAIQ